MDRLARPRTTSWLRADAPGLVLALLVFACAVVAYTPVVGYAWDDGVYVAAGHWLADGDGYVLRNRVGDQTVPTFPPGYPLLVSLAWRLLGDTPSVLFALALGSALSVGLAWYLWWRVLRRHLPAWTAWLVVAVPALSYEGLVTSMRRMTDAPYALVAAAPVALAARKGLSNAHLVGLACLAAVAVPLRSAGAVLAVSVLLILLVHRRW